MASTHTSTFSFSAPFPSSSVPEQRHVSVSLSDPESEREASTFRLRDDTGLSSPSDERSSKVRRLASPAPLEKKDRKKWTMDETQMLVDGCNRHGVGNWEAILNDASLHFDNRSPVCLKDRFRAYFPAAYKQHLPSANTHLSSELRSALPDGTSFFGKMRSKTRPLFTEEEDRVLKAGYDKHGTDWATIVNDPIFEEQNRRPTDPLDQFPNVFFDLYQAGCQPRYSAKKRLHTTARVATDEYLHASREMGPARRKRRYSTGSLRGETKSVPQSPNGSEEDSSGDDNDEYMPKYASKWVSNPESMKHMVAGKQSLELFCEVGTAFLGSAAEPLAIPKSLFCVSNVADSSHSQTSSALDRPTHSAAIWSTGNTAVSPVSSSYDFLFDSPFLRNGLGPNGVTSVGKSAWTDLLSANPRLDQSTANSSSPSYFGEGYFGGMTHSPNAPFAFTQLTPGFLGRDEPFLPSLSHDFASEDRGMFRNSTMMPSSALHGADGTRIRQPPDSVDYEEGSSVSATSSLQSYHTANTSLLSYSTTDSTSTLSSNMSFAYSVTSINSRKSRKNVLFPRRVHPLPVAVSSENSLPPDALIQQVRFLCTTLLPYSETRLLPAGRVLLQSLGLHGDLSQHIPIQTDEETLCCSELFIALTHNVLLKDTVSAGGLEDPSKFLHRTFKDILYKLEAFSLPATRKLNEAGLNAPSAEAIKLERSSSVLSALCSVMDAFEGALNMIKIKPAASKEGPIGDHYRMAQLELSASKGLTMEQFRKKLDRNLAQTQTQLNTILWPVE